MRADSRAKIAILRRRRVNLLLGTEIENGHARVRWRCGVYGLCGARRWDKVRQSVNDFLGDEDGETMLRTIHEARFCRYKFRQGARTLSAWPHRKPGIRVGVEQLEDRQLLAADFTVALLPDTQIYSALYPEIFQAQTQWIADHVQSDNIVFVSQIGDVVDHADASLEWQRADAAMDLLDGDLMANPEGLVPYSVVEGHHDFYPIGSHSGTSEFTNYFGGGRYTGRSWYGGASPDDVNHFQVFSGGGHQFLHLTLEWEPRASTIDWAQGVIDAHAGMPTIVSTHSYLDGTNGHIAGPESTDGLDGEGIFKYLIEPNPQIFMVLCGHIAIERHTTSRNNAGLTVFEIMADYQDRAEGGQGYLQLLKFRPDLNRVEVSTYSPWLNQFETDVNSQFALDMDFEQRFSLVAPPLTRYVTFDTTAVLPGGITAANEDIVRFDGTNYSLLFDGSDVGLATNRLTGFARLSSTELLLSLGGSQTLPGITPVVAPTDIVKFTATKLGSITAGSFSLYFRGSQVGLSDSTEAIDAFDVLDDGQLLISTIGAAGVPGVTAADEDLLAFTPTSLGATTSGSWLMYLDGSDVQLGPEDVDAVAVDSNGRIYLSVQDAFAVSGVAGDDEDVFVFDPTSLGSTTAGSYDPTLFLDGSLQGLGSFDLTGFDLEGVSVIAPNARPAAKHDLATGNEDESVIIDVLADNGNGSDYDPDGALAPSTTIVVFGPAHGDLVNHADGTMTYSPGLNFFGVDTFTYSVRDNAGAISNLGIVTIAVNAINDPPVAQDDSVLVTAGRQITISVLQDNGNGSDSDADGTLDATTVLAASVPAHGALSNNGDGSFTYTADPGYAGTDSFAYAVMDNEGAVSNTAIVTITVMAHPLVHFALDKNAVLPGGVSMANEDVATFNGTSFSLLFDGSDVGLGANRLSAFTRLSNNELLMSLVTAQTLPGLSETATPSDIVKFTATALGGSTAGSFSFYFQGGDVDLGGTGEAIDSIEVLADGRLLVSTGGAASVSGVTAADEDLLAFTPTSLGTTTTGSWALYLDGSDIQLGSEDIDGAAVDNAGRVYLSVQDGFAVNGVAGDDEDVFVFDPTLLGSATAGSYEPTLFFDGSLHGLASYDLIGVDIESAAPIALVANSLPLVGDTSASEFLHETALPSIFAEAAARWSARGADGTRLASVQIVIANLNEPYLGLASGNTITLDRNAAGWGWFVDATPKDDTEFMTPGSQGELHRMDLLTVIMHELGHLLGHGHEEEGVMNETLAAGVRRAGLEHDDVAPTGHVFGQVHDWLADARSAVWAWERVRSGARAGDATQGDSQRSLPGHLSAPPRVDARPESSRKEDRRRFMIPTG